MKLIKPAYRVLITDLDNTLWDWFYAWFHSFDAMLTRVSELSGVPREVLEPEVRAIHRLRHTTEYSYLLNEIPSLIEAAGGAEPMTVFDDALHVLNSQRLRYTTLYPGVLDALRKLSSAGVRLIAYTESVAYWTEWRMKQTHLDGLIDVLYSAPDHDLPVGVSIQQLRQLPDSAYGLNRTTHLSVPRDAVKPNALVLRSILEDSDCAPDEAVYLGDSLMKDIAMAQAVGVLDVHAKYGEAQYEPGYDLLRRVSHWSDADIEKEKQLSESSKIQPIRPSVVCDRGFEQILSVFQRD